MALHMVVCIKAVVTKIPVKGYVRTAGSLELNPFDRSALEMALRLKQVHGGQVTVLTMGPEASVPALYEARAMGADRIILVSDSALAGSDTLATSKALSGAVGKLMPFDLLFFGVRSFDSDTGQVGPQTAVLLDLPLVTAVHAIDVQGDRVSVERRADGFLEAYAFSSPGVLTIDPASVPARDPKLAELESAFQNREEQRWALSDLEVSADAVGWRGSATKVPAVKRVVKERKCTFLTGSVDDQAARLIERIRTSGVMD